MSHKLKILYAEDNRVTAQETTEALEDNGYEVKTVFDGNEAWLAFQSQKPDLAVLDCQMPGKTGLDVFLLIRQIDKHTPVLILSSYTELCAASLKVGTSDFVRKDGGIDELCARIETAWQRRPNDFPAPQPANEIYRLSAATHFQAGNATLIMNGCPVPLNGMLAEILTILCQNPNVYLPKQTICKRVWNNDSTAKISLLCDYVSKLRQILKTDPALDICSSYGRGYCLKTTRQ